MHFAPKISIKPFPGLSSKTFPVLTFALLLMLQVGLAQVTDNFSDGNVTIDPPWVGTSGDFIVNAELQLQLNGIAAGTSWLVTEIPANLDAGVEWNIFIRQSFSPSAANYGRVYLASDEFDLSRPLNGYYLQFGETGSNDAVELFRQSGSNVVSICRAPSAAIANAFGIRVKIIRHAPGSWQMFVDYSGGQNFALEATGNDGAHPIKGYFGIKCTYTITNANRFYFDDILMRTFALPDITPPEITSVDVLSGNSLRILFSEPLDEHSVNANNFFVSPGSGHPSHIEGQEEMRAVVLNFSEPLANGHESYLRVENVKDVAGNTILPTEIKFVYFHESPVAFRDIIITEILADPAPQQGLPEAEFLELYNRSANPIDLSGWVLSDQSTSAKFGGWILLPDTYLIITSSNAAEEYSPFGKMIPLSPFPSLNNTGDIITLRDDHGILIDSISYALSWYRENEKAEGGWSLELIDVQNICDDSQNWSASEASEGGSPGKQNSVFASRPDNRGPVMVSVIPTDSVTLLLSFNEKLDAGLPALEQFSFLPGLEVSSIEFDNGSLRGLVLNLADPMVPGTVYTISVSDIFDCPGNRIQEEQRSSEFILPQRALRGDVIVNEILFNPRSTGVDFVEVYNRSEKTVDIVNWSLRNYFSESGPVTLSTTPLLLRPGDYLVFTEDKNVLKGEYPGGVEDVFAQTDLPGLNDDEGSVVIVNDTGAIIDSVFYSAEMHSAFVKDDEAVSLERISFALESAVSPNWRSASSTTGFATPGYLNSNARPDSEIAEGSVVVEPEVVQLQVTSQDFTRINYSFKQGGVIANVRIYDQQGRSIREIASNELLGTEGFFRWDGEQDDGNYAARGYYLVWFETFDLAGRVSTFRKRVAVF